MAAERPGQTAVDYLTIVLSPVLIMGLVGSLVFFLLEVFYEADGKWRERLQWILFFFVFGAVLTARISMMGEIASRAGLYGTVLALLTYIGMQTFVEYPPGIREASFLVNLGLVVVVWWCAHRLTWDCTNVDEDTDMSGQGLLQAAGIEESAPGTPAEVGEEEPVLLEEETKGGLDGWWQRYREYREKRNKKRTLGVWVVYFSLAALPIFGLGQSLVPLTAPGRRQFTFWLMTVYVACGMGLLLTTCFLGLRRYLRQKRLQMPPAMTATWLTVGGTLLLVLLFVGALLPRPHSEYPLLDLVDPAGSAKRKANRMALAGDSPGEGKGRQGAPGPDGRTQGNQTGDKGEGQGKDKDGQGGKDRGEGKDGSDKGDSGSKGGENKDKDSGKGSSRDRTPEAKDGKQENPAQGMQKLEQSRQASSPPQAGGLQKLMQRIGPILRWIVFAILAVVVLVALIRGGLGFLSNFTLWARRLLEAWRNFWASLFGARPVEGQVQSPDEAEQEQPDQAVPFSAFANPFDSGEAQRLSARDLVRYTFRALEAWAREHDLGRRDDETALEFLGRLGDEIPALEEEATRLGQLHARAEYGKGGLPSSTPETLRDFWDKLERVRVAPMSA